MGIKNVILGLDVSTKTVGVTLATLNENNEVNVLEVTHLRPKISSKIKGTEALFKKCDIITEGLKKYKAYNVTDVVIEEPLVASNNSGTVATLLRYNGMVSQSVYNILGVVPTFISSYDARKFACPQLMAVRKYRKNGEINDIKKIRKSLKNNELVLFGEYSFDCSKKLILWNYVSELFPNIQWQYAKNGELKDENFDASDSLICVLGFINQKRFANSEPTILDYNETTLNNGNILFNYTVDFCDKHFNKKLEILTV